MATTMIDIGSRRELFVDGYLIQQMTGGASLRLHRPVPREISLVMDKAWEGNMSGSYCAVFEDEGLFRMYYKGWQVDLVDSAGKGEAVQSVHPIFTCYAESPDGITWCRPTLGIYAFDGATDNNIVLCPQLTDGIDQHGFSPFKDTNPASAPEMRYKGVGASGGFPDMALYAFHSADAIHWSLTSQEPIITDGKFDSQNLAFWDAARGEYRAYIRDFRNGSRAIKTCTSPDFVTWSDPVWLDYEDSPDEQLYVNQVTPYHRAPHLLVGFPTRYVERPWSNAIEALPELAHRRRRAAAHERFGTALTEGLFMSSRDGQTFRRWGEAFIRPGPQSAGNWAYGDNYQNWGLIETTADREGAPNELSIFVSENYWRNPGTITRRHTLRVDGFVSVNAPMHGGELVTKPLQFAGGRLSLNVSTSAAGSIKVELQTPDGGPIPGFALDDAIEIFGDSLDFTVSWRDNPDLRAVAGPVRLRFVMRDADLYAMQFSEE